MLKPVAAQADQEVPEELLLQELAALAALADQEVVAAQADILVLAARAVVADREAAVPVVAAAVVGP
jgi:hypothetical protein